jgi:transposase
MLSHSETTKRRLRFRFNTPPRELVESLPQLHTPQRSAILGVLYFCEKKAIPCNLLDIQSVFGIAKSTAHGVVASGRCRRLKNADPLHTPTAKSTTNPSQDPDITSPQSQSGSKSTENVKSRRRLTAVERELVIGKLETGSKAQEVADELGVSDRSIRNLYKKYRTTGSTQDRPRSGRPGVLSVGQKRLLHREYQKDPSTTYPELQVMVCEPDGVDADAHAQLPSKATIYRALKEAGADTSRGRSVES